MTNTSPIVNLFYVFLNTIFKDFLIEQYCNNYETTHSNFNLGASKFEKK